MKRLFGIFLALLGLFSGVTWWFAPSHQSDLPQLYWVTTSSPVRDKQVLAFRDWLRQKGYPDVDLRIDAANNDASKKLIQGISGVGGDLFDNYADQTHLMQSVGILADLTDVASEKGFGPGSTYDSVADNFMINGRQWGYPSSVSVAMLFVNVKAFEEAGLGVPPRFWDIETFEDWGRRYVAAKQIPGERQRYFFANSVERYEIFRSLGLSFYNETLTACTLNDARYIRVLEKIRQWIEVDHLLPGPEEESTFAVEGSGMGVALALFARGNYALLNQGRFALIRLREYEAQPYSASFMPHYDYINTRVAGGTVGLYTKSKNKDHAYHFLEYLSSDQHNRMIVETGGGLPVNPSFLETEAFLQPKNYPNEWDAHATFSVGIRDHSIGRSCSPYILPDIGRRIEVDIYRAFIAGRYTAAEAAAMVEKLINDEIGRTLDERPSLMDSYRARMALQEKIDTLKADGKKVPEAWIYNPFHRRYFADTGQLEEEDTGQ